MKNFKIAIIFCMGLMLFIYACKKEQITDKSAAQKQFLGRWPVKYRIRTTYNNFTTRIDTTINAPIDTLIFSADGKFVRRNNAITLTGDYSLDEAGENITFSGIPVPFTQRINYIRVTTIGLVVSDTTIGSGATSTRIVTEDQLAKK